MHLRRLPYLLLCCLFPFLLHAQERTPGAGFCTEVNYFSGKVLKHTSKFKLPIPDRTTGIDVNLQWKTYGKHEWEQRRRYPTIGIGFTYTNYGIDSVYGKCLSIYPNIQIPLLMGKRFQWAIRVGNGAGFVTRKFSRLKYVDTLNNAIGSTINDYASVMMDLRYLIDDHWQLQAGANFSHISNASFHQPNLGINMYGTHVGVKYFPVTSTPEHVVRELKPLKNRWLGQFRLSMAFNESNAPSGPTYPVYLVTAFASKRWISKNKVFAGFDYSYHGQVYAYLKDNQFVAPGTERCNAKSVACFIGNEFLLGRVGFVLQAGYYLRQTFLTQSQLYQKLGGNLYLVRRENGGIKEVYLCAFLKTHTSTAELTEFGFGMSF